MTEDSRREVRHDFVDDQVEALLPDRRGKPADHRVEAERGARGVCRLHPLPEGITGLVPSRIASLLTTRLLSPTGRIRAALDVTEPEPLPPGHPLWELPNCLITPHTADTEEMTEPLLAARIAENVRRLAGGRELEGLVDPDLGY